jgi:bacterioferritin
MTTAPTLDRGVLSEENASKRRELIELLQTDFDLVTQDLVLGILHDEEGHLRLFEGFLREFEHERGERRS